MSEKECVKLLSKGDPNFKPYYYNPERWMFSHRLEHDMLNMSFKLHLVGLITNNETGILSQGENCRETFFGTYKSYIFAKKTMWEYRPITSAFNWKRERVEVPNPAYVRGHEVVKALNVLIPIGYPFAKRKDQREENDRRRNEFWAGAQKAVQILNFLEEVAGWETRTSLFAAAPTNMFPRGNSGSVIFSAAYPWGNTSYLFSLFLLICRLTLNPFLARNDINDVETLVSFIRKEFENIKTVYTNKYPANRMINDMVSVLKTSDVWLPLVRSYKKVYGNESRKTILSEHKEPYSLNTRGVLTLVNKGPEGEYAKPLKRAMANLAP